LISRRSFTTVIARLSATFEESLSADADDFLPAVKPAGDAIDHGA
jgi:hypothetical protein